MSIGGPCTWQGCTDGATFAECDKQEKPWAYLCVMHHNRLDDAISSGRPASILATWIKAQGGAKKAAARI